MDDVLRANGGRRARKKSETRKRIIKMAMYMFQEKGFAKTTMEEIAEEADISRATLYNYFPFKEAIISDYWQGKVSELKLQLLELIQLLPDTKSRIQKTFMKAANELLNAHKDIYEIYLACWLKNLNNPGLQQLLQSGFDDVFSMIIRLGQQTGDIRKDMSPELLVRDLEIMFMSACIHWLSDPRLFPLEDTLVHTVSLFVDGAGTGSRQPRSRSAKKDTGQKRLL